MSTIEKMMILGIRSFGPDEREKQVIEFFSPLTLILGPNGTGKTTIIECLKYITTGDLPPGGKTNAAFIHDPKIAGETEVKAQVRLVFHDVRGQKIMASRSLMATQKTKKVEMKTMDQTITRTDADGNKVSISGKCAEMNNEMVSLLGVAKPILDNVIFCHQEESSWPLSEGKALKVKFDDIFASTRYVKAMDAIQKFRKEQNITIKVFQEEIKYLKQNKDKASQIRGDLEEAEARNLASKDTVDSITEKLEPVESKLQKLRTKSGDIFQLQTEIENLRTEERLMKTSIQELRRNIKHNFQGTTEELQQLFDDFEKKIRQKEMSLNKLEARHEKMCDEMDSLGADKSELLLEQGRLEMESKNNKDVITNRDASIKRMAVQYKVSGYSGKLGDAHGHQFLKVLEDNCRQIDTNAKASKAEFDEQEKVIQGDMDFQRNKKTKLDTEQKMKMDRVKKNKDEVRQIQNKLSRMEASAERLKDIQRDQRRAEKELEDSEKAVDLDGLRAEIQTLQKDKTQLDAKMKQLDSELNRMSLESTARTQLDMFRKEKTSRQEQTRRLKGKIEDSWQHLIGKMPEEGFRRELDQCANKLARSSRAVTDKLRSLRQELSSKETRKKMEQEQLDSKERELRGYEERLNNASGSQNFDVGLDRLQLELKKTQEEKGHLQGVEYLYKKYRDTLSANDPGCPLCHRPFDAQEEVRELIEDLERKLNMVPDKLESVDVKINRQKHRVEEMLLLKPVRAAMTDLCDTDIPNLRGKIQSVTEQIAKLTREISEKEEEQESLSADEQAAQMIQTDATMIDKCQGELRDLERKVTAQAAKLSSAENDRSMQEVQAEREEIQLEQETVNSKLDKRRQKLSEQSEHVQKLKAEVNELQGERLRIESDLQQQTRLEEDRERLEVTNVTLQAEIEEARHQMEPMQKKIDELQREKMEISRQKDRKYEEDMRELNSVRDNQKNLRVRIQKIDAYVERGGDAQLQESREHMIRIEEKASKLEREREDHANKIASIREDLANQKVQERELSDSIQVRQKEAECEVKVARVIRLEEKLGGLDVINLNRETRALQVQMEKLLGEKRQAEDRQHGLEGRIMTLRKDLREDMYKDAEQKYRDKMIDMRTTELSNKDLEKYYKALDRTIMSYHSKKMAEINKIIAELWRNTYRGNDIETIEIRTDEEEGNVAAKNRRSYQYRVVMIRSGQALDMRGRCSAGQKVLASLIIRLALAETFCLNCGILALDEPTTNLDRENIESLAFALVEIIKSRSKQRNFQLLVITHDEDFVELLGRSEYVDEFWKVGKDQSACSRLKRAKVQDLHSK